MMKRHVRHSLLLLTALITGSFMLAAEAAQLGNLDGHSAIGQPLDATIGVWLTAKDKAEPVRLKLTPDIAYRANRKMTALVERMSAEIVTTPNGRPYIQLRSDVPIDEPVLAFRLKIYVGENAIMRNFSLTLNPAPRVTPSVATRTPRAARSREPITDANYTVAAGDTLWAIARRVSRANGGTAGELVEQIFRDNPQAFVNGDRDRLMLGAPLRLPIAATAAEPAPSTRADTETVTVAAPIAPATTAAADADMQPPAPADSAPESVPQDMAAATPVDTSVTTAVATVEGTRPPVDWRKHEPELAAQLEALRLKYIALKMQYAIQKNDAARATAKLKPQAEAIADTGVDQTAAAEPEVAAAAPAPIPAGTTVAEAPNTDTESFSLRGAPTLALVLLALIAIVAITIAAVILRNVSGQSRARRAEREHHAKEADFKAEVARKAANRIQMESEVQRMFENREVPVPTVTAAAPTAGMDADSQIDHDIAHGRYDEAEAQLRNVIERNPKNYSAKLRLLEVYYITENVDPFCDLADDLHTNHRAELTDEEWRRVVRMGKITAPDRVPFSGPRGLENPRPAS